MKTLNTPITFALFILLVVSAFNFAGCSPEPSCELLVEKYAASEKGKEMKDKDKKDELERCTKNKDKERTKNDIACSVKDGDEFIKCLEKVSAEAEVKREAKRKAEKKVRDEKEAKEATAEATAKSLKLKADIKAKNIAKSKFNFDCVSNSAEKIEPLKSSCDKFVKEGLVILKEQITALRDAGADDKDMLCYESGKFLKKAKSSDEETAAFKTLCKEHSHAREVKSFEDRIAEKLKKDKDWSLDFACGFDKGDLVPKLTALGGDWSKVGIAKVHQACVFTLGKKILQADTKITKRCSYSSKQVFAIHQHYKLAGKDAEVDAIITKATASCSKK